MARAKKLSVVEPVVEVVEPVVEAVVEPVVEAVEPVVEVVEPVVEVVEPIVEVVEPVVEVVEPVVEVEAASLSSYWLSRLAQVEATSLPSMLAQVSALSAETEVKKLKTKSQKNENVWGNVKMLFDAGKTNKEALAEIHEMYGNTSTSYACIAWYRNKYNKLAKSDKMTVEQLLNQIGCQFGQDQEWIKAQVAKL